LPWLFWTAETAFYYPGHTDSRAGLYLQRRSEASQQREEAASTGIPAEEIRKTENIMGLLGVDHMEIEIGYALIPW
jgi:hypothetical protein